MKWLDRIKIYFCCQSSCSLNDKETVEEQRKRYKDTECSNSNKKEIS